jgi:DNA-directed RNA polymerase
MKDKELSIKAFSFLKGKYSFKSYIPGEYNLIKQKRATMPNLIHSLDATTIALLHNNIKDIKNLYTVHDCFATTVDYIPRLILNLKLTYINLYSNKDYIIEFDRYLKFSINKLFGEDVYKINDDYINIPVNEKYVKIKFPDIGKVINKKDNNKIINLKNSSYTLI